MEPEGNTEEKKLTNEQNKTQVKSLNSKKPLSSYRKTFTMKS